MQICLSADIVRKSLPIEKFPHTVVKLPLLWPDLQNIFKLSIQIYCCRQHPTLGITSLIMSFSIILFMAPPPSFTVRMYKILDKSYSQYSGLKLFTIFRIRVIHNIPDWSYSPYSRLRLFTKFWIGVIHNIL